MKNLLLELDRLRRQVLRDFYSFGLTFNSYTRQNTVAQNFLYNGKELQNDLSLDWYDYVARMYMPEIGRWGMVDPLADVSKSLTPYRYSYNNPIRFLDPNGLYETDGHYWTVYLMGTLMGSSQAREIAYYAEYPDNVMSSTGDVIRGRPTWLDPTFYQPEIHSLTGFNAEFERRRSTTAADLASTMGAYGEALHRLGDSFAHTNLNGSGNTYMNGVGHAADGHIPDKIATRPELYLQYVRTLEKSMGAKFGHMGNVDLFTFEYIAKSHGSTEQNSAIFETEIRIQEQAQTFTVAGDQRSVIQEYLDSRNSHTGIQVHARMQYADVTIYLKNQSGQWTSHTETRTIVGL